MSKAFDSHRRKFFLNLQTVLLFIACSFGLRTAECEGAETRAFCPNTLTVRELTERSLPLDYCKPVVTASTSPPNAEDTAGELRVLQAFEGMPSRLFIWRRQSASRILPELYWHVKARFQKSYVHSNSESHSTDVP